MVDRFSHASIVRLWNVSARPLTIILIGEVLLCSVRIPRPDGQAKDRTSAVDLARDGQQRNNSPLRRRFPEHAAGTLDGLMGMGLRFHGPSPEPPNRLPRVHNVVPNAKAHTAWDLTSGRPVGEVLAHAPTLHFPSSNC
jgi:hypothetical protein